LFDSLFVLFIRFHIDILIAISPAICSNETPNPTTFLPLCPTFPPGPALQYHLAVIPPTTIQLNSTLSTPFVNCRLYLVDLFCSVAGILPELIFFSSRQFVGVRIDQSIVPDLDHLLP
jgi:hypothetical protein